MSTQTAEDAYIAQHAAIQATIERLEILRDGMLDPTDNEITWGDVACYAHIADALATFTESIG